MQKVNLRQMHYFCAFLIFIIVISSGISSATSISYSAPYPTNNSVGICPPCATLSINVSESYGNRTNITFYSNLSGVWDYFYIGTLNTTITNVTNGSYAINIVFVTHYNSTYYWYVNTSEYFNDSNYNVTPIYQFHTANLSDGCYCNGSGTESSQISYAWVVGLVIVFSSFGILAFVKKREVIYKKRRKKNEYEK